MPTTFKTLGIFGFCNVSTLRPSDKTQNLHYCELYFLSNLVGITLLQMSASIFGSESELLEPSRSLIRSENPHFELNLKLCYECRKLNGRKTEDAVKKAPITAN